MDPDYQKARLDHMDKQFSAYRYPLAGTRDPRLISFQDTCVFRGAMGGVAGGVFGAGFAVLMSAMNPMSMSSMGTGMPGVPGVPATATGAAAGAARTAATSAVASASSSSTISPALLNSLHGPHLPPPSIVTPVLPMDPIYGGSSALEQTSWQQVKSALKDTGRQAKGNFKTFGIMSGTFTSIECLAENTRGTSDDWNTMIAGCSTGAVLAARSGPQAMAIGCVGFASFSYAMEKVMHNM